VRDTQAPSRNTTADPLAGYNDAELCQLQEMQIRRHGGCTSYSDKDLDRMRCTQFVLSAGDTLYMPKGVIHFARTGADGSAHITLSLQRTGARWIDIMAATAINVLGERSVPLIRAMSSLIDTPAGVPLLDIFPMHLLPRSGNTLAVAGSCSPEGRGVAERSCWDAIRDAYRANLATLKAALQVTPPSTYSWTTEDRNVLIATLADDAALAAVVAKLETGARLEPAERALAMASSAAKAASRNAVRAATWRRKEIEAAHDAVSTSSNDDGLDFFAALTRARRATDYGAYSCSGSCNENCVRALVSVWGACDGASSLFHFPPQPLNSTMATRPFSGTQLVVTRLALQDVTHGVVHTAFIILPLVFPRHCLKPLLLF